MLTFRATGDWAADAVRVSWKPSTLVILPAVEQSIDAAWDAARRRKNVDLFDGPMCRLESF